MEINVVLQFFAGVSCDNKTDDDSVSYAILCHILFPLELSIKIHEKLK